MSYLCYLCLFAYTGVHQILCCVFALFFFVLFTICCQFFWIVHFLLPLRYSLAFIAHLRVLIYLEISQKIMFVYICIVIEYSITKWERVGIPVTDEKTCPFNSKMINPKVHGHILTFRKKDDFYKWIILYVKR
jgi:hypothetical protein